LSPITKGPSGPREFRVYVPGFVQTHAVLTARNNAKLEEYETEAGRLRVEWVSRRRTQLVLGPFSSAEEAERGYLVLRTLIARSQVLDGLAVFVPPRLSPLEEMPSDTVDHWMVAWRTHWGTRPERVFIYFNMCASVVPEHEHVIRQESADVEATVQHLDEAGEKIAASRYSIKPLDEVGFDLCYYFAEARTAEGIFLAGSLQRRMRFMMYMSILETIAPEVPANAQAAALVDSMIEHAREAQLDGEDGERERQRIVNELKFLKARSIRRGLHALIEDLLAVSDAAGEFKEHFVMLDVAKKLIDEAYRFRSSWTHGLNISDTAVVSGDWGRAQKTALLAATEGLRKFIG
jgi:hypothetical protein